MLDPMQQCAAAAAFAVVSHLFWFKRGEHDFYSRMYAVGLPALEALGYAALTRSGELSRGAAVAVLFRVTVSYLATLTASILAYRAFFHPLKHFPGPFAWKLSKFAQVAANQDKHGWKHVHRLHQQYGQFVRIGPNEISIIHPDAPQAVLGPGTKFYKAPWYDMGSPLVSMHQMRDKKTHDRRRRTWDQAFSARSLRNYEDRVVKYADELFRQLAAFGGAPLNASKWFNFYSFDVMGDLAFGKPFDMLTRGETHFAIELLQEGMAPMSFGFAIPWLFWILTWIPGLAAGYHRFIRWSEEQALARKAMKVERPDIMHWLLESPPMSTSAEVNRNWLAGDARLVIVAGSDTTAATLTFALCELLRNPAYLARLRVEVEPLLDSGIDHAALQKAELLNSIIHETLRLHPPVPSVMLRVAPPEGATIAGRHIPGGSVVNIPPFSLQRSPAAYEDPDAFVPERWTSSPGLVKDKRAHVAFSLGAFNCIGKNLALMELRTVLAALVTRFDVSFAPGEDGRAVLEDTEEHFTLSLADMKVCCVERKASE